MRASVIVPARDSASTLGRALEALSRQELDDPYEVIVVDDGSRDATPRIAERAGEPVRLLPGDGRGVAHARNRGAAEARGDVLAFTDADCFPEPGWLRAGLRALQAADLVQGAVRPDPARPMGPFDRSLWVERESGLYETANLFVRRELFERLGGFEAWLEPEAGRPLAEDLWLGWRARRTGARTTFCASALVHHAVLPRGAREYVAERRRLRHFPEMAAQVPELRRTFLFGRLFLSRRSAAFDAALVALAAAAGARSPLPAAGALPYAWLIARRSLESRLLAPLVAPVEVAADAVGLVSLVRGSLRRGSLVL